MQSDEMTGCLAPQVEHRPPKLELCWPDDITDDDKARIRADANAMQYLRGQPPMEQMRQIAYMVAGFEGAKRNRVQQEEFQCRRAEEDGKRAKREAELAPFRDPEKLRDLVLALERRVASAEAEAVLMRTHIAELGSRQPKPSLVSRIRKSAGVLPPEAA